MKGCALHMRKLINEIQKSKRWEKCLIVLAIVLFCLAAMYSDEFDRNQATRLVRREMTRMGYHEAAATVVLEASNVARVYRASIPIQDSDGVTIRYWRLNFSFWWPDSRLYVTPVLEELEPHLLHY